MVGKIQLGTKVYVDPVPNYYPCRWRVCVSVGGAVVWVSDKNYDTAAEAHAIVPEVTDALELRILSATRS